MSEAQNNLVMEVQGEAAVIELSWWERLKYLLIEPSKTMEYLAKRPKILFPMVVVILGFLLLILLRMDIFKEFLQEQVMKQYETRGIHMEQVPEEIMHISFWTGIVGASLAPFITMLLKSGIVHVLSVVSGSKGKFKAVLSVIGYAYIINLLGEGIRTIIAMVTKNFVVYTSPAVFLPDTQAGTPVHTLLSSLDVFVLWYLAAATIGLAYTHSMNRKKAGIIVFGSWLVGVMISVVLAFIKMKA
ncbi:Yip1 family protein [Thermotalea metallivorans]|uniref:Yip1 domain-containing protein n=1 Tax=Thermotalea metallivorans TaxID=520762 RepID=A0A140L533_9FIRM|nr:Yip1 family protein [Thermotalea metallivorans]KXG75658.1 hypothetical protein AN619_16540 [Thermotalea metallivorans]